MYFFYHWPNQILFKQTINHFLIHYELKTTFQSINSTQYRFVIKIKDNNDIIEVKLSVDTTIIKVNKANLNVIPIHSITGSSRTRSNRILLPSPWSTNYNLKQTTIMTISSKLFHTKTFFDNPLVGDTPSEKLPLVDLLNTNTNKSKAWIATIERKRKGQSIMA